MKARRILWLYCVLAVLGLTAALIAIVAAAGPLRNQSSIASEQVKNATAAADAQRGQVTALEEDQRGKRAELSAEEAIRTSYEVQQQQAILKQLDETRKSAEDKYELLSVAYQNHMKRLIPIIALLILHLAGTMLFWPRRG